MTEIFEAFSKGNKKAFVAFITAGDPSLDDTKRFIDIMQSNGVDLIEIGIPFSDPIAEGVVIQEADLRALKGGTDTDSIFDMLATVDKKVPIVFMTYANPVYFYGYDKFFRRCKEVGVSGIIIPDIPFEESGEVKEVAVKYGVKVIDMVAPTSEDRIKKVCSDAEGFVYLVSSMGVTGMRKSFSTDIPAVVKKVKAVTKTPVCVGFGISTPEQARSIAAHSDGIIIGSAIVKIIAENGKDADGKLKEFISSVAEAVHTV